MSFAEPADEGLELLRDKAGRLYADADPLPDLRCVLEHARRLHGVAVAEVARRPDAAGRAAAAWSLAFDYRGHRFGIQTDYHAGLTFYTSPDADCPEPLLRAVAAHFEGLRRLPPTAVPLPPLDGRRLLLLFLLALALAAPLAVFLVSARQP